MTKTTPLLTNFGQDVKAIVIGASGGIGKAFIENLCRQANIEKVIAFSRSNTELSHPKLQSGKIDLTSEQSIETAANIAKEHAPFDIIIIATGFLHNEKIMPEKSIRNLSFENFEQVFTINTFGPAMIAKHFLPLIPRDKKTVMAFLSARVGSISDNRLGGWHAYRSSKTALNMLTKTIAIEVERKHKQACIINLHPGTVNTALSEPFQKQVKEGKLFTPEYSSTCLLNVINTVTPSDTGKVFAWDGKEIPA